MPLLWQEAVVKLIETLPKTWSEDAYYESLSALENGCLRGIVHVGIAECMLDVAIEGAKHVLLYETCGFDWWNSTAKRAIADSGVKQSPPNVVLGGNVIKFRLTRSGEEARHSLSLGLVTGVIHIIENTRCPFTCRPLEFEAFKRRQARFATGAQAVAAAQANASVGDIHVHNHIPPQPATVVNITIPSAPITAKKRDLGSTGKTTTEHSTPTEGRAELLRSILWSQHFDPDDEKLIENSQPVSLADVEAMMKGKPGWSRAGISRAFNLIFKEDGHSEYVKMVEIKSRSLKLLLDPNREGQLPRTDGNETVSKIAARK